MRSSRGCSFSRKSYQETWTESFAILTQILTLVLLDRSVAPKVKRPVSHSRLTGPRVNVTKSVRILISEIANHRQLVDLALEGLDSRNDYANQENYPQQHNHQSEEQRKEREAQRVIE